MAKVTFGGKEWSSLEQLCRSFNKTPSTVRLRLKKGMELKDALHKSDCRGHKFIANGKEMGTSELAKLSGVKPCTIRKRLEAGWEPSEIGLPRQYRKGLTAFGRTQSFAAWAKEYGMKRTTLRNRLVYLSPEVALSLPVKKTNRKQKEGG